MRDGEITQVGRYDDILQSGTDFVELVGAHQKALTAISAMNKSECTHQRDLLKAQVLAIQLQ